MRIGSSWYVLQRRPVECDDKAWADDCGDTSRKRIVARRKREEADPQFGLSSGWEFRILVLQLKEVF